MARSKQWQREQQELQLAHLAFMQRNSDTHIAQGIDPDEEAHYEQMALDSLLYDQMERGY